MLLLLLSQRDKKHHCPFDKDPILKYIIDTLF